MVIIDGSRVVTLGADKSGSPSATATNNAFGTSSTTTSSSSLSNTSVASGSLTASHSTTSSLASQPPTPSPTPSQSAGPTHEKRVTTGVVIGVVLVVFIGGLLFSSLYLRRKRKQLNNIRRSAIRRMTMIGPSQYGRSSFFNTFINRSSTAELPKEPVPAQPRDRLETAMNWDRSSTKSKQGESVPGTNDRLILVDGVYVLALDTDEHTAK